MTPGLTIGIFGRGRLAQAIREAAPDGVEVLWMVGRDEEPAGKVDVAIDASRGEAVAAHLAWALETGTDLVIGATGWALADLPARVGDRIGVLTAPNFSLSVALMARFSTVLGRYAELAPELDPWLLESHHRQKADAPSGTALRLMDAFLEGCPRKTSWVMNPQGPLAPHLLSVGVLRAGSDPGTHVLGLDGAAETLRLEHHARSRGVFGAGALRAARWLKGRKGCHTFDALAAELLDPLFAFGGSR